MRVTHIDVNTSLGLERGQAVVSVLVQGASEHLPACLRSILDHASEDALIVVCDDGSLDSRGLDSIQELERLDGNAQELFYLRTDGRAGPVAAVNGALSISAPADAVLLSSECVVAAGRLDRLRRAAYSESTVATASALSCELASWNEAGAAAINALPPSSPPRLSSASGPCVYVRRSAIDLVGDLDARFVAGTAGNCEFSAECVRHGLTHVLADDVLVLDRLGGGTHGVWIRPSAPTDIVGPLPRTLSRVRRTLSGLSVLIDARILSGPTTGTRIQVLETIGALARTERMRLGVVVPDDLSEDAARGLESLNGVSLVTHGQATSMPGRRPDLVHRPSQVNNPGDLTFLLGLADRLVITQEDLISYYNASYFPSLEAWDAHRRLTRTTLAIADQVVFVSADARDDALADDLVDPARARVVRNGVHHQVTGQHEQPVRPPGAAPLPDDVEVILCLGTDYRHKNRLFGLRMLQELVTRDGWRGRLVFAGPHVPQGSSAPDEQRLLAGTSALAAARVDVGSVNEAEKAWLLRRASLVIYPTVHEGFGLVPFDAASRGVPCMWAAGTSLSEILPEEAASIVPWDAATSADRALQLLRDERARRRNLEAIRSAGERLTWDGAGARLLELYEATFDTPTPPAAALERRYGLITGHLSEDAMRLAGPGGALPADIERPLLALATHPRISAPVFSALKLGYRTSYRVRRWGRNGLSSRSVDRQSLR